MIGTAATNLSQAFKGKLIKLTPQGSVIWSREYAVAGYASVAFEGGVSLSDGSFVVTGIAYSIDTLTKVINKMWGILFKVDAYGNLIFTKAFNTLNEVSFYTMLHYAELLPTGDMLVFGYIYTRPGPNIVGRGPQVLFLLNAAGEVKWKTEFYSTNGFTIGTLNRLAVKQVKNGDLVLGFREHQSELAGYGYGQFLKEGFIFLRLDYATGNVVWKKSYRHSSQKNISGTSHLGSVVHVTELQNGDLGFSLSFSDSSYHGPPPYVKRGAIVITNNFGSIQKIHGYYNNSEGFSIIDVADTGPNGEQVILGDDGNKSVLFQTDNTGAVVMQKAYHFSGGVQMAPENFFIASKGYSIFSSDRSGIGIAKLMKTDTGGVIDCEEVPVNMVQSDVTKLLYPADSSVDIKTSEDHFGYIPGYPVNSSTTGTTICFKACCTDVINPAAKEITLCKGESFTLPDNNVPVKDSGMYYVSYKSAKGCDSIAYYHVTVLPDPSLLEASGEFCLHDTGTTTITATPGFSNYTWFGNTGSINTAAFSSPGKYSVSVGNTCGNKTVSFEITKSCEAQVIIPTAFTPNGDGLNDYFSLPALNTSELLSLSIFNRSGQKIFETKDKSVGWDGRFQGKMQAMGVYVYLIRVKAPDGKITEAKGTVTLIR